MATRHELGEAIAMLQTAFPSTPSDKDSVNARLLLWERICGDLEDGALLAAVDAYLSEPHEFHPAPGVIRAKAFEMQERRSSVQSPSEAFTAARFEASRVGAQQSADLDELTRRTIARLGGWRAFCLNEDELQWQRKHFVEIYNEVLAEARDDERMLPSLKEGYKPLELPSGEDAKDWADQIGEG